MLSLASGAKICKWIIIRGLLLLTAGCAGSPPPPAEPAPSSLTSAGQTIDRRCSSFNFLWARHAELLLRFDEALEYYQKALACDGEADTISEKIPILLLRLERTNEACTWLAQYLENHADKVGMRMLYAKVLQRQGKTAEAMGQYEIVSQQNPEDAAILLLLSEMYISAERPEAARSLLARVFEREPNSYLAHILTARMYLAEKNIDNAVRHYNKALARNWSAELQMELGQALIKAERYREAARLYKELIKKAPHNEPAYLALVQVYLLQKKEANALGELYRLREVAQEPQRVEITIARLYAKQKRYGKAILFLKRALRREELSEARYFLALLQVQQGQLDTALQNLRHIEPGDTEYEDGFFLQIRILREQDDLGQVRRLLKNAIEQGTMHNSELYIMLAALYQFEERDELSKKVLRQGMRAYPRDVSIRYEYGLLLENEGNHERAMEVMQEVIKIKPDHAAALNFIGYSWAEANQNLEQALGYILRAIQLNPDNGFIYDSLGWVYYRLGAFDKAIDALKKALELTPEDAPIHEHIGDVYQEGGQIKNALQAYSNALLYSKEEDPLEKERLRNKINALQEQESR
nr:tetratricopeptide repeat protein [uncultured Desulfobulbus sp.]